MPKIELIGGKGFTGENNKDILTPINVGEIPVAAHIVASNPVFTDDYIFRVLIAGASSDYPLLQIIDRKTLTVIRYLRWAQDGFAQGAANIDIRNGKLAVFVNTSTTNRFLFGTGLVSDIVNEALNSELGPMVINNPTSITWGTHTAFAIQTSTLSSSFMTYDGVDTAFVCDSISVHKFKFSTKTVEWSKSMTDVLGGSQRILGSFYLSDRIIIVSIATNLDTLTVSALRLTDGGLISQKIIMSPGTWNSYSTDVGVLGEVGNDIIIKTPMIIARMSKITLNTVWSKRFPFNATNTPCRLNIPYNEVYLSVPGTPPSGFNRPKSVKLDLTTGKVKKILVTQTANIIQSVWHVEGDDVYAGTSTSIIDLYKEIEKV